MRAQIYYNVRKKKFSVRWRGRVMYHTDHVILRNAKFLVSEKGRQRVLATGHKNVHAYVSGEQVPRSLAIPGLSLARYNPFQTKTFVDCRDGNAVTEAEWAELKIVDGRPVIGYRK